jgi:adenylate cyclase
MHDETLDPLDSSIEPPPVDEAELRRQIEDYYLPTQLVDAIMEIGGIPAASIETEIGIGFLDIADYSLLSRFLAPRENQAVLNGLYAAFNQVLRNHGGYLNKIEGDSIMFHFGGLIDPNVRKLAEEDATRYVARELFYTCIEMQRKCALFNSANRQFLSEGATAETRDVMQKAFDIISKLRNDETLAAVFGALYQIRVRIGASIGTVTIGNFGPDGAKQWDVIGEPVIEAKRMESTAPIGGLRISKKLFDILDDCGRVDEYFERFRREAMAFSSHYRTIERDDLFRFSEVLLKDKGNVTFPTYKVQVAAQLPEAIARQVELLLIKGTRHTKQIMKLLDYYRGNKYVISAIEATLRNLGVVLRKEFILGTMYPSRFEKITKQYGGDEKKIAEHVDSEFTLFELLDRLGRFQDIVKQRQPSGSVPDFVSYDSYMQERVRQVKDHYNATKDRMVQRAYFFNVVYPLVFDSIETSIIERQQSMVEVEELAEV